MLTELQLLGTKAFTKKEARQQYFIASIHAVVADNQNHVRPPQSPAMIEVVADNENKSVCHDNQQRKRAENI